MEQWRELDENFAVGEFRLRLHGWNVERRFVVIRERIREDRDSVGRKLIDVPGYTFRVFVTSCSGAPEEIWRDYNGRADMENRIAELKHDLGADGFCLKEFFATEAAFRAVLLLFNLLSEFQRAGFRPSNLSEDHPSGAPIREENYRSTSEFRIKKEERLAISSVVDKLAPGEYNCRSPS